MKKVLFTLICFLALVTTRAQELNCIVTVSAPKLEGTERRIFETLQTSMYEFMNQRKWTNYNVKLEERIDCTVLLTLDERPSPNEFRGTLNVVVRRPVFNTAYYSTLFNFVDKDIEIQYDEYQPLDYADGAFASNLTSLLAYYAYTILGIYFDSFSLDGGSQFFSKAQDVVSTAQGAPQTGWKAYESQRNRFWLAENYMNPSNGAIREFNYKYHRLGLDQMYDKVDAGRAVITESINLLNDIYNQKPDLFILTVTLDAKKDELVNIYSDSRVPPLEKNNVVNILKEIDPANSSKYSAILESK